MLMYKLYKLELIVHIIYHPNLCWCVAAFLDALAPPVDKAIIP